MKTSLALSLLRLQARLEDMSTLMASLNKHNAELTQRAGITELQIRDDSTRLETLSTLAQQQTTTIAELQANTQNAKDLSTQLVAANSQLSRITKQHSEEKNRRRDVELMLEDAKVEARQQSNKKHRKSVASDKARGKKQRSKSNAGATALPSFPE